MITQTFCSNTWNTSVDRLKSIFPRTERIFLPLPVALSSCTNTQLFTKGIITRAFLNGYPLQKSGCRYFIPIEYLHPWENEIVLTGWPISATLLADGLPLSFWANNLKNEVLSQPDPLVKAGLALSTFIVDEGTNKGDMFSFYDPLDQSFRLPRWRWDTGICLEAFARLYRHSRQQMFKDCAMTVARRIITLQISSPACPGGFPEAMDLHMNPNSFPVLGEWVAPFNGAFIGCGLLATATIADALEMQAFLQSAVKADKLMSSHAVTQNGYLRGYYHASVDSWLYHGQINDSGIYPRLPANLSKFGINISKSVVAQYANVCSQHITREGYTQRAWFHMEHGTYPGGVHLFPEWKKSPHQIPAKVFARGQAWCLLGLISAWSLNNDLEIANAVRKIIEYLLRTQEETGFWPHDLRFKGKNIDVKGTAVVGWALAEARSCFFAAGGDHTRLNDSLSLAWEALCNNQMLGYQQSIPGAILDDGEEGAIIYFRNRPMYVAYGTAAFILMGLEMKQKIDPPLNRP